tara:strand:+ start:2078 stop:2302 length:225 start_codon:yes stop_codon:yes gene_type:complete
MSEEIDINELRKNLKNEVEAEWKLALLCTSSDLQAQFNAVLEDIKNTGISKEQYIENAVEHKLNEILNSNEEKE